ncbi:putative phosphatidyl-N-methylethanolamine N-methyltransferase [Helianthus annuus]|nr:putative phosphatidyl-N-methylethanolamine N-methyltransferase [Helianthus annuus]
MLVGSTGLASFGSLMVYQLLGEAGTYYGVRFGKNIPWVTEFPFGTVKDPQYVGSIMSLVACVAWVPFLYIFLWVLGYLFMIHVESKEDPASRAKPLS